MANKNAPFGFRAMGKLGSDVNNMATNEYSISDDFGTALFQGMMVGLTSGVITAGTATSEKNLGVLNGVFISKDPTTGKPTFKNQYAQTNVATGETIIPFSEYTYLSIDSGSMYFKQDLNTFQPSRFYKILIKVKYNDGQEIIYDDDSFQFKVVR